MQVTLSMHLDRMPRPALTVVLVGTPADGGGIAMISGTVTFGPDQGTVTSLDGGTVVATVSAPAPETLTMLPPGRPQSGALAGQRLGRRRKRPMSAPTGPTRLLDGAGQDGAASLDAHLARWGALPAAGPQQALDTVEQSGLRGHGGAWFPVGAKWHAVASQRRHRPVVIANGAEGEPASGKDRYLLHRSPHLVLDGAAVAAAAVRSGRVVGVGVAQADRLLADVEPGPGGAGRRRGRRCPFEIAVAPNQSLAGRGLCRVNPVNGRTPGIPSFVGIRSVR